MGRKRERQAETEKTYPAHLQPLHFLLPDLQQFTKLVDLLHLERE